jgi:hypothetical protein
MAWPSTGGLTARSAPWAAAVHVKPALLACVLISIALHGCLVLLSRAGSVRIGDGGPTHGRAAVMSVRVVQAPAPLAAPPLVPASSEAPVATNRPTALRAPSPPVAERRTEPSIQAPAEIASAVQIVTTTDGGVEYVPRALLSTVPEPVKPLAIPYPSTGPSEGHFTTVLALFIDESGAVQRVRLDGPMLPPVLDAAAREAFLKARWQPGQVDGRLVKSLIRVEVVFESGRATQTSRPLD